MDGALTRVRKWSCLWDLNPRPRPYQGRALPTELRQPVVPRARSSPAVERARGIEPPSSAWKAVALPLSYTRNELVTTICVMTIQLGEPSSGGCRIRTYEGLSHQIYSLTPLTARETPRVLRISHLANQRLTHPTNRVRKWGQRRDLNPQPADYKSAALPIELRWRIVSAVENQLIY